MMLEVYSELPIIGKLIFVLLSVSIVGFIVRSIKGNSNLGLVALAKKRKQCSDCKSWIDETSSKCKNCGSKI